MHYRVYQTDQLEGTVTVPPSKSHTLRAILFASLARGESVIRDYLMSPDTDAMINACRLLGAEIKIIDANNIKKNTNNHNVNSNKLLITGVASQPELPNNVIDAGNSGQVLRFIAAVASLTSGYVVLTGDASIRNNRPIQPILNGLKQLNVFAESCQNNGTAPIIIKGPHQGGVCTLNGEDSQPVSGLLIASAFAKNKTIINVEDPGEKPWIDLTLAWFKQLGIGYQRNHYQQYIVDGHAQYNGFDYTVPGDFSAALFPIAAALITNSAISLQPLDMQDSQGDKAFINTLTAMGAVFAIDEKAKSITVEKNNNAFGKMKRVKKIDINPFIDALPMLTVLGCYSQTTVTITNAAIARRKESDRLSAITKELTKMGGKIKEFPDGLVIEPARLKSAIVESHRDHRIAMALAVAGLSAQGETIIRDTACVAKSYPHFVPEMRKIGAQIEEIK